jgi:copper chaperone CopZ
MTRRRKEMLTTYKTVCSIVLMCVLVVIVASNGPGSEAVEPSGFSQIKLRIEGMTWGAWPTIVRRALEGLKGVKKAEVSFSDKEAIVYFEEGKVTLEEMVEAVRAVGFRAAQNSSPKD